MPRNLIRLLAASIFLCAAPAMADVPYYEMDPEKSSLKFFAIQNDSPVEGEFSEYETEIFFDPDNMEESKVKVTVETGSVTTNNNEVTHYLKQPEWLSVIEFPKAVFESRKFSRMPNSNYYYVEGTLTMHGKTMPVILNFQMEHMDDNSAVAKGYTTLYRKDYNVGQGQWSGESVVKDEVRVEFRIVATKKPAPPQETPKK